MVQNEEFSEIELEIINCYLDQNMSIREISQKYNDFGRTKIRNVLEKYAGKSEENANKIKLKLYNDKTHKNIKYAEEIIVQELFYEEIEEAYAQIISGQKTLTELSAELKKNRETLKRAIIGYLANDKDKIKLFKSALKENQIREKSKFFDEDDSEEEKLNKIFISLNSRRQLRNKRPYSTNLLRKKSEKLMEFFEKRNQIISDDDGKITKNQLLKMMYDYPTLLSMSLKNKIMPSLKSLEETSNIGKERASMIIREHPAILGSSQSRTQLQFKILNDSQTLPFVLEKPRILRTSPELLYSQIQFWNVVGEQKSPFITSKKLYELYQKTPEDIQEEFDIKEKYSDDEYFDRS